MCHNSLMEKPVIGITLGDPAGIGPEIIIKALSDKETRKSAWIFVFGGEEILIKTQFQLQKQYQKIPVKSFDNFSDMSREFREGRIQKMIPVLKNKKISDLSVNHEIEKYSPESGQVAFESIKDAINSATKKEIFAVVTTPINKEGLKAAGIPFVGHTEIFGGLTNTENPLTMFQTHNLRVFFLSRHISLKKACDYVTEENIFCYLKQMDKALNQLNLKNPFIAVAGLNPHCGEHGLFGNEEREIEKAIKKARKIGINVEGPIGADSVFNQAKNGKYTAVLSLYHDQGHIACKTLDFDRTVSLTLGLPFLRTSVDHGTAYDIAGTGKAQYISLKEGIKKAVEYFQQDSKKEAES